MEVPCPSFSILFPFKTIVLKQCITTRHERRRSAGASRMIKHHENNAAVEGMGSQKKL